LCTENDPNNFKKPATQKPFEWGSYSNKHVHFTSVHQPMAGAMNKPKKTYASKILTKKLCQTPLYNESQLGSEKTNSNRLFSHTPFGGITLIYQTILGNIKHIYIIFNIIQYNTI